jgi:hypothetical protein
VANEEKADRSEEDEEGQEEDVDQSKSVPPPHELCRFFPDAPEGWKAGRWVQDLLRNLPDKGDGVLLYRCYGKPATAGSKRKMLVLEVTIDFPKNEDRKSVKESFDTAYKFFSAEMSQLDGRPVAVLDERGVEDANHQTAILLGRCKMTVDGGTPEERLDLIKRFDLAALEKW